MKHGRLVRGALSGFILWTFLLSYPGMQGQPIAHARGMEAGPRVGAASQPVPLLVYSDSEYGFSFTYPAALGYTAWQPALDIQESASFYDAANGYKPEASKIALTVFANPGGLSFADWLRLHSNPRLEDLPAGLIHSAALFEDAGSARDLLVDGMPAKILPQISSSLTAARLLIYRGDYILSLAYTDFGDGGLKEAFKTMVASFRGTAKPASLALNKVTLDSTGALLDAIPSPGQSLPAGAAGDVTGYKLPWMKGVAHWVAQGWGGTSSHDNTQMWYAYDFDMPEGEPVRASRGGTVSNSTGNYTACGGYDLRNSGNRVTLNHDDGSATLYLHLKQVNVPLGSVVAQGQDIGLAGNTGWTGCYVHLHFQRQAQGIWITNSQAIYFDEYPGVQLSKNASYISQNGAGPGCAGPALNSPAANFISTSQTIDFSWSPPSGCTFEGYTFRVKDTADMDSGGTTIVDTDNSLATRTQTIGTEWNYHDLYWGVRTANPLSPNWSVQKFRIEPGGVNNAPNTPTLASPASGSTFSSPPQLCWINNGDPEGESVTFNVSLWGAANQTSGWIPGTCWTPSTLPEGAYTWNVRARDVRGAESGASSDWNFSMINPGTGVGCGDLGVNGVILFENANCNRDSGGAGLAYASATDWIDIVTDPIHDRTSSIYIGSGWSVKVYEAATFDYINGAWGGSWRCLTGSMWDLSQDYYDHLNTAQVMDDTISSLQVFHNGTCSPSLVMKFRSVAKDGWILESSETSRRGGSFDADAVTLRIGDNTGDTQYRSLLSFNTSGLPDSAVITKATLKIRKSSLTGSNPFSLLGKLRVDIRVPYFGAGGVLEAVDFQALANGYGVGFFSAVPVYNWYSASIGSAGYPVISRLGATQFRLYFSRDDNDNLGADFMEFYSGNASTAAVRPLLVIEYYVP